MFAESDANSAAVLPAPDAFLSDAVLRARCRVPCPRASGESVTDPDLGFSCWMLFNFNINQDISYALY